MSTNNNSASDTEELDANMAPQERNPLALQPPGIEFLVQWDTLKKPASQYLILQEHKGEKRLDVPFKEWDEDEPDWYAAFADAKVKFGLGISVDLKMGWKEKGEEKSYLIFSDVTVQELMNGHFFEIHAAEPPFADDEEITQ